MDQQVLLNTYADQVYRRQGDSDYITARMNFRFGMRNQFLWAALQAIEKYLKAILLYHGRSVKGFRHDLPRLYSEVRAIHVIEVQMPQWTDEFMSFLSKQGANRYLTTTSYMSGGELGRLDECVWSLRRYCQYIPDRGLGKKKPTPGLREAIAKRLNHPRWYSNPISFRINGGELERILNEDGCDLARRALIWRNVFYGKIRKSKICYQEVTSFEIPPQERNWFTDTDRKRLCEFVNL